MVSSGLLSSTSIVLLKLTDGISKASGGGDAYLIFSFLQGF